MKKNARVTPAPNWTAIFEKRPDLKPPGFDETCAKIKKTKEDQCDPIDQ